MLRFLMRPPPILGNIEFEDEKQPRIGWRAIGNEELDARLRQGRGNQPRDQRRHGIRLAFFGFNRDRDDKTVVHIGWRIAALLHGFSLLLVPGIINRYCSPSFETAAARPPQDEA